MTLNSKYLVRPDLLRPLPPVMRDVSCDCCSRPTSQWSLHEQDEQGQATEEFKAICSKCFLYASNWGSNRLEEVKRITKDLEAETGMTFKKDRYGRLVLAEDADRVLGGIVLGSRVAYAMQRQHRGEEE